MPLFKVGNFGQIAVSFAPQAKVVGAKHKSQVRFPKLLSLAALEELSFNIEPPTLGLARSPNKWGLYLKRLSLFESFEGFIANVFNQTNEIYFVSAAWDYSGSSPFVYPPKGVNPSSFVIPMEAEATRQFIGDGVNLWPPQHVIGALNLVIIVYESDDDDTQLGQQLIDIHEQVGKSQLATLITAISASPAVATGVAIGAAVNELIGLIGKIMKRNGDDYVDLFEGTYGTDKPQQAQIKKHDHEAAGIEIEFTIS